MGKSHNLYNKGEAPKYQRRPWEGQRRYDICQWLFTIQCPDCRVQQHSQQFGVCLRPLADGEQHLRDLQHIWPRPDSRDSTERGRVTKRHSRLHDQCHHARAAGAFRRSLPFVHARLLVRY